VSGLVAQVRDFGEKLTLVLKVLSISRARLAMVAGVDKSLVGRWCAGTYAPAAHNLERITQTIAERLPHFTMHDWDRSLPDLAARLGVARPAVAPAAIGQLTIPIPPAVADATRARAADLEGIWRVIFSAGIKEQPALFAQSYMLMRLEPGGRLLCRALVFEGHLEGSVILVGNQIYQMAINQLRGTLSLSLFNHAGNGKAQSMDGITLACREGLGGTPLAVPCYAERVADLTGDGEQDDRRFVAFCAQHPLLPPGAVRPEVSDHLLRDAGRATAAAGGDLAMMMPHLRSLARSDAGEPAQPALRIVS
jgi:hypothetical protein